MISKFAYCLLAASLFSTVVAADESSVRRRNDAIIVRAIERMEDVDFSSNEHVKGAISRHLSDIEGTEAWVELAAKFKPTGMNDKLAKIVLSDSDDSLRVRAIDLLISQDGGRQRVEQMLKSESTGVVGKVALPLGLLGNVKARELLAEVVLDAQRPFENRKDAIMAMARSKSTSQKLIALAESGKLPADTRLLAGGLLVRSSHADIRDKAATLFPQPQQKDHKPLPPLDQLAQLKGDAANGATLFRGVATCGNCHPVNGQGKQVGPDLSEIGSKLSREAMLTSILDPNAGISHNYEGYVVLTNDGQVINGLLISKSDDEVVIRTIDAIDRTIASDDIDAMKQSEKSIMPENLHHTIDQQGLIDIVQYMTTLTKK